jgi:hypothetical protein
MRVRLGLGWSAANQAVFRRANDELREFSGQLLDDRGEIAFAPVPFLCECGNASCTRVVRLTLGEYDRVRARERHHVVLPGHEGPSGRERVTAEREHYVIVERLEGDDGEHSRACA